MTMLLPTKPHEILATDNRTDMNYLFALITCASLLAGKTDIVYKVAKLNEEDGELSAEILKKAGYKNSDAPDSELRRRIIEEAVDVLLMAGDILTAVQANDAEMIECGEAAIEKWLTNLNKKIASGKR